MKFAIALQAEVDEKWHLARQMGLEDAVGVATPSGDRALWDYGTCVRVKKLYEDFGFNLAVIEGWLPMEAIKRGTPEREGELERVLQAIRNLGALEIPVLCYIWMAFFGWFRTSVTTRARGGALTSSYEHRLTEGAPEAQSLRISEQVLWDNFEWFLQRALPVAEKAGVKLALHPDDPPLSPVMGVPRLFCSVEGFERGLSLIESEANGMCYCQGNFSAMGVDVPETIRSFGRKQVIHFVHFRDVRGTADNFVETFHDEGKTDMFAAMQAYREIGFEGAMRPDHAPAMHGDPNTRPGYEARGRLFAIGYMKGLLEGVDALRRSNSGAGSG
jgi:mannonate dehydratase